MGVGSIINGAAEAARTAADVARATATFGVVGAAHRAQVASTQIKLAALARAASSVRFWANSFIKPSLARYCAEASYRQIEGEKNIVSDGARKMIFLRGMLHFEPGEAYLNEWRRWGYDPTVFRFSDPASEGDLLRQWRANVVDIITHYIDDPGDLETDPVFVGHSAGGISVYILACIAKARDDGDLLKILHEFPELEQRGVELRHLQELSTNLAGSLFYSVASPLNGIGIEDVYEKLNDVFVEPLFPLLFSCMTTEYLSALYQRLGRWPHEMIDINAMSEEVTMAFEMKQLLSPRTFALVVMIQGAMKASGLLIEHEGLRDGPVAAKASDLMRHFLHDEAKLLATGGSIFSLKRPLQIKLKKNHLACVEMQISGERTARAVEELYVTPDIPAGGGRRTVSPDMLVPSVPTVTQVTPDRPGLWWRIISYRSSGNGRESWPP